VTHVSRVVSPRPAILPGLAARSEPSTVPVSPVLVERSRHAVSTAARFSEISPDRPQLSDRPKALAGLRLHLESYRANSSRSRRGDPRLLSWASAPYSTSGGEGPRTRACQPASFRLQGLVTLVAAYSLRCRAGFVSRRRRSWDSPFEAFSARKVAAPFGVAEPTCRLPADRHVRRSEGREPQRRGFWALTLAGVPCATADD
jgi:hypothetical protein